MDFPPSVNRLWRTSKNGLMYRSKEYTDWRKKTAWELSIQAKFKQVSGAYKITVKAVRPDKRRRDLDNLIKSISDVLVAAGVIEDDSLCEHLVMMWVSEGPACHVMVEGVGNEKTKTKRTAKA